MDTEDKLDRLGAVEDLLVDIMTELEQVEEQNTSNMCLDLAAKQDDLLIRIYRMIKETL